MYPARARTTDPPTSHEAAASVTNLTEKQHAVLHVLKALDEATDATLVRAYREFEREGKVVHQSESGIRTRRNELASMDPPKIVRVGTVKLSTGRRAIQWRAG